MQEKQILRSLEIYSFSFFQSNEHVLSFDTVRVNIKTKFGEGIKYSSWISHITFSSKITLPWQRSRHFFEP